MRSGELARLSGVTVRALRHYHQIGVLDEPARSTNGYRHYDVHDLIRVLRIRHLASLGIPLERMSDLLDGADDAAALLETLDADLVDQIDRLVRQREVIALLRDHDAAPDLPPELAPFFAVYAGTGLSPDVARMDRDQSVLLAHFAGDEAMGHLTDFYERLTEPDTLPIVTAITESFARLGPDSTDEEIATIVEGSVDSLVAVLGDLAAADPPVDFGDSAELLDSYLADRLNSEQRRAIDLIKRRAAERLG